MIQYQLPDHWIKYDESAISMKLIDAKAAIASLRGMPYQREWVEKRHALEFKREVAGTSRIEGADFTEKELEAAMTETTEELITRSQRQASAAVRAYRWIAEVPDDRPLDADLILEIHRQLITGADDDHCEPGTIRSADQNVTFGQPRHRGASGGSDCDTAFGQYVNAISSTYSSHDPIIQAIAVHYHLAAMHPFTDGNGRTARALEALMLQRAGLRDTCFIAMSNYYYEEKTAYLSTLSVVRAANFDLTRFIEFALIGIHRQITSLLGEIQVEVSKALFKNMMYDLFNRMESPKKRVIAKRQVEILKYLLNHDEVEFWTMFDTLEIHYAELKHRKKAYIRDINGLIQLMAVTYRTTEDWKYIFQARLEWPTEITETEFFERLRSLPQAKTHQFLNP